MSSVYLPENTIWGTAGTRPYGKITNSVRFLCIAEGYTNRAGKTKYIHTGSAPWEYVKFSLCGVRNSSFRVPIYRLVDILDTTVKEIEKTLRDNGGLVEFDFAPISGDFVLDKYEDAEECRDVAA